MHNNSSHLSKHTHILITSISYLHTHKHIYSLNCTHPALGSIPQHLHTQPETNTPHLHYLFFLSTPSHNIHTLTVQQSHPHTHSEVPMHSLCIPTKHTYTLPLLSVSHIHRHTHTSCAPALILSAKHTHTHAQGRTHTRPLDCPCVTIHTHLRHFLTQIHKHSAHTHTVHCVYAHTQPRIYLQSQQFPSILRLYAHTLYSQLNFKYT